MEEEKDEAVGTRIVDVDITTTSSDRDVSGETSTSLFAVTTTTKRRQPWKMQWEDCCVGKQIQINNTNKYIQSIQCEYNVNTMRRRIKKNKYKLYNMNKRGRRMRTEQKNKWNVIEHQETRKQQSTTKENNIIMN